jgi:hypothetical protein
MLSLASLWQRATQLQQELKNDDRSEDYWHMAYVQDTTDIAQWIQSNTEILHNGFKAIQMPIQQQRPGQTPGCQIIPPL